MTSTPVDPYATHIPVLKAVFNKIEVKKVFELGMGLYSTPFFCDQSESVFSIEQQEKEWFEKVSEECSHFKNWKSYCLLGPEGGFEIMMGVDFDFGFVDGHVGGRAAGANLMLKKGVSTVVIHDTGLVDYYGLRAVKIPYGYNQYHYRHHKVHPRTTIITKHNLADMEVEDHSPMIFGN